MSSEELTVNNVPQPTKRRELQSWMRDILNRPASPPDLRFWRPPQDPDKPSLPYTAGFNVEIRRCQAPTAAPLRPELPQDYLKTVTHSEAIMARPPLNPGTSADADIDTEIGSTPLSNENAELVVTAPIAIGVARGAQLLAVTITRNGSSTVLGKPFEAVARIYDPLYYRFESEIGHHPEDCVYSADRDCLNEATAYEHLDTAGQIGCFTPEYHGCWTFDLPIKIRGSSKLRSIKLILIERLNGNSILSTRIWNNVDGRKSLNSFHFPEEFRLDVLARAMDGYVRLLQAGLVQRDFAARNLIIAAQNPTTAAQIVHGHVLPRVVLIDYNNAYILDDIDHDEVKPPPPNPATVFGVEYIWKQFPGWVPHEWEDIDLQNQWLLRRFGGPGQRELYLPIQGLEL